MFSLSYQYLYIQRSILVIARLVVSLVTNGFAQKRMRQKQFSRKTSKIRFVSNSKREQTGSTRGRESGVLPTHSNSLVFSSHF